MADKHILLVENETGLQITLALMLRQANYRVTVTADGLEAFNKIIELKDGPDPVDLLITDMHIPEMDGEELIDNLRQAALGIPVIAITECAGDEITKKMKRQGCADHINKPFEPQILMDSIRGVFGAAA